VGASLTLHASDRLDLFANYDLAPPTGNQLSQTLSAGARFKF
jgi:hypothetical protein